MFQQRTLASAVHAIGIGVHSGEKVRMTLRPAEPNSGIRFVRTDAGLDGQVREVRARAELVTETTLATTLGQAGVEIGTVEHLLSALWGLAVDNVTVLLHGGEVPIMDGSAEPFVTLMQSAGVLEQDAPRRYIRIRRELRVQQGDGYALLRPHDGFEVAYTFVADHPVYNRYPKSVRLDFTHADYIRDLSRARSFGRIDELPLAHAINRCLGSSLDNAVGVDSDCVVNPEGLRYVDEFVRHKVLDAIGDLYLLGHPLIGAFEGFMSGHALNNKLARALLRCEDAWEYVTVGDADGLSPRRLRRTSW